MSDQAIPLTAKDVKPGMYIRLTEERIRKLELVRGTSADSWYVDNVRPLDGEVFIYVSSKDRGSHILQYRPEEEVPLGEAPPEQDATPGA